MRGVMHKFSPVQWAVSDRPVPYEDALAFMEARKTMENHKFGGADVFAWNLLTGFFNEKWDVIEASFGFGGLWLLESWWRCFRQF